MFLTPLNEIYANIYGNILGFIVGLIVILMIMRLEMNSQREPVVARIGQTITWSILGIFMAFIGQMIAANIEVYIFNIDTSSENTEMIMKITELAPLFSIITALIAPILEEIVFRKIIFGALYKRMNFILAGI